MARTHADASLPTIHRLRSGLQAEAIAAEFVEAVARNAGVLQIGVRGELHTTQGSTIATFAISHAVATVGVAGDAGHVAAQFDVTAHVLAIGAEAHPPHRVPRVLYEAAVEHAFDR